MSTHLLWEVAHAVPHLTEGTRKLSPFTLELTKHVLDTLLAAQAPEPHRQPPRAPSAGAGGRVCECVRGRNGVHVMPQVSEARARDAAAAPAPPLLIACIPPRGKLSALPCPRYELGSPALRLQLELSNSHFSFIKLTNKCPAGEQASSIDSAPPLGPISLLHFNIY